MELNSIYQPALLRIKVPWFSKTKNLHTNLEVLLLTRSFTLIYKSGWSKDMQGSLFSLAEMAGSVN